MRAPFIMRNIWRMPSWGRPPTRMPRQRPASPKFSTAVAEARMPSLCSMDAVVTSLGSPRLPSSLTQIFGTMKSESPLVPVGAPSMRASTMWTMFWVRS
jgi:hypothetical protein